MGTRNGRRTATFTVLAVIVIAGALIWLSRDHIRFFLAFESLSPNAQGYAEFRHRQTCIVFVALPGGTFLMGSPEDEEGHEPDQGPVHEVTVSRFLISKFEVTQAQWEKAMGSNPSFYKDAGKDAPVEEVSWDDCRAFCVKTGLKLPSEAQWEYACRAGTTSVYYSGDTEADLARVGWYAANAGRTTLPVGEKEPNAFGIHDMHGNVWEWCEDVYSEDFYSSAESSGLDPVCAAGSPNGVARGGCWADGAQVCCSAYRYAAPIPSFHEQLTGFRPAARLP